jgi:hypothetical protein
VHDTRVHAGALRALRHEVDGELGLLARVD